MARKMTAENSRKKTLESLMKSAEENGLTEKFYEDYIDQYMLFYDNLFVLNEQLSGMKSGDNFSLNAYTMATSEKRRISGAMRNILSFLGLKPSEGGGGYAEL